MTKHETPTQNVCLVVIDGWGVNHDEKAAKGDAIAKAKHPVMEGIAKTYPESCTEIEAHGLAVGLPDGLMGNSEVGHLNIGAGRVVYQDIVRIEQAIARDTLKTQPNFVAAVEHAKKGTGRLHLLGLVSDGGVHAHIAHLFYMLRAARDAGVPETWVHVFGDGRDTAPESLAGYLQQLVDKLRELKYGKIADITGRYYAMDRDKRWDRVELAFRALVLGEGEDAGDDPVAAVKRRYAAGENDEFLKPLIVDRAGVLQADDAVLCFNFRSDRMRQLASVLGGVVDPAPFDTEALPKGLFITTLTRYNAAFPFPVIFPPQEMDNVLAEWLGELGVRQLHVAETEKYAHVTFFFNGGVEKQFPLEDRELVPSPKVATYDLQPEMSCDAVADKVVAGIAAGKYPLVMCNFAPPDMVGHCGILDKAIIAIEATDAAIGKIRDACAEHGYVLVVTADHGNAERMIDPETGSPDKAHTCNPVPLLIASSAHKLAKRDGALCDVAPTVLSIMGLSRPSEMTGESLVG